MEGIPRHVQSCRDNTETQQNTHSEQNTHTEHTLYTTSL